MNTKKCMKPSRDHIFCIWKGIVYLLSFEHFGTVLITSHFDYTNYWEYFSCLVFFLYFY